MTIVILISCSNEETLDYSGSIQLNSSDESTMHFDSDSNEAVSRSEVSVNLDTVNRQIIFNAYLDLKVKEYSEALSYIEEQISALSGYIITQQTSQIDENLREGHLSIRIPQESLQLFIERLNTEEIFITYQDISGEDVTEEYIDLAARLESKEIVEARLLTFMDEADSSEDLLNISNELADVQLEIEQIKGRIQYIENRSELATVTLSMIEQRTDPVHEQDLNIWERTKDQWMRSYNFIVIASANIFVLLVGNLPLIGLLITLTWLAFFYYKKRGTKSE